MPSSRSSTPLPPSKGGSSQSYFWDDEFTTSSPVVNDSASYGSFRSVSSTDDEQEGPDNGGAVPDAAFPGAADPVPAIQVPVPLPAVPAAVVEGAVQLQLGVNPDEDDYSPVMTGINPQTFRGALADDAESWIQFVDLAHSELLQSALRSTTLRFSFVTKR
jgi:hypothetical protein